MGRGARRSLALALACAGVSAAAWLAVACSSTSSAGADASAPSAPSAPEDAATPDAARDAAALTDGGGGDDGGAAADGGDGGPAWLVDEMPERSAPDGGWLSASQGNSPSNWLPGSIGGAATLDLFTYDPTGGISCGSDSACGAGQCLVGVCRQRVKQKSPRADMGYGAYEWRLYVPTIQPADAQLSLGAFVYADDAHELDFECGPGKAAARASAALSHLDGSVGPAAASEMLCYLVSQGNPASTKVVAVPMNAWHTLGFAMTAGAGGRYDVRWSIDGVSVDQRSLAYGPADACEMYTPGRKCTWQAFVSVENLAFLGDTYPTTPNHAHLDWFRFAQ